MSTIALRGVTKRYADGTEAVKQLDLEVADGEFVILVGPSGCGKSTALRMVAGLEEISDGELAIDGERVNELHPRDRDIAMVFQNYALYPSMTVRQNMGFALRIAKVDEAERRRRVEEAADVLDLTDHLDRKPANLSGGQRQRVAMGRAIVREPAAFLMDEPLSNLDAKLRVQMRTEIARLQRRLGTTTIYVTHDQTEAMTLGDRVAVMRGGVVQQVAAPEELYERPANLFVAGFIGSPAMNLLPARLHGGRLRLPFGEAALPDEARRRLDGAGDREVVCGLRPEDFEDAALAPDQPGLRVRVEPAVVESMGSERYAYFEVDSLADAASAASVADELGAAPVRHDGHQVVARLGARSRARPGETAELVVDVERVQLFDPESGANLVTT